jgi:hypothetical protein
MTFKSRGRRLLVGLALLALGACGDENSIAPGLVVHLGEVHTEGKPGDSISTPDLAPSAALIQGGYDQAGLEKHPLRDAGGRTLSLYRAYVAIDDLRLVPCWRFSALPAQLLDFLIPAAQAHSGHGSEPVGGRALDKPNVIDIVTREGFHLPLGDLPAAPERYCGIEISVVRLAGDAYGLPRYNPPSADSPTTVPEVPELAGSIFALRADYCALTNATGECTQRIKVDVDDGGLAAPLARRIAFDQPLELDGDRPEAYVSVGFAYGEWVRNVDVTSLAADPGEVRKLLDNIAASIYVNAVGLGELPPNIL